MAAPSIQPLLERLTPRSLHHQLAVLFALLFAASITLYAKYTGERQYQATVELLQRQSLAWTASVAAELIKPAQRQIAEAEPRLRRALEHAGADALVLTDAAAKTLTAVRRDGAPPMPMMLPEGTDPVVTLGGSRRFGDRMAQRILVWVPILERGRTVAWLHGEFDTRQADEVRDHIFTDSVLVGLIAVLAATLLVLVFLRGPMRSLRRATDFANHLDRDFGTVMEVGKAPTEIAELGDALSWASLRLFDQNAALIDGEKRKSAILESALDCIMSIDAEGRITEFNPAAEQTFGWRREEMLGESLIDRIVPERFRATNRAILRQYAETGSAVPFGQRLELRLLRRDGGEFSAEAVVAAIELDGQLAYTVYLRDITERKRTDAALIQAKEAAEAANRTKGDFLANMSHEIRTPMNAIIGMTELALDTPLNDEQREYLSLVKSSADALLEIINEVLDFSKIEAGRIEFERIPFSVSDTVGLVVRTLAPRAREKGLALSEHIEPGLADVWLGDPLRLRQVLMNLVGNALKFTREGGIDVSVVLESEAPTPVLRFTVRDSGIGIPADKQQAIFDAFSQADTSTTRKFGGTGLGLTISQRIVQGMGGRIWVDSEPDQGSSFHFTVPLEHSSQSVAPPEVEKHSPPPASRRLSLLLAEDNPVNQMLACRLLEKLGHSVHVVGNGADAIAALREQRFDAVLMDVQMPVMGGFEATAKIREMDRASGRHTLIIAMTAHAMEGDREKCLTAGMDGYVAKPIQTSALLAALGENQASPPVPVPADAPLYDRARVLANLGDDEDLLNTLREICLKDLPTARDKLAAAAADAAGDGAALAVAAHTVKGMVGNFGADAAVACLGAIERSARDGDLAAARARLGEAVMLLDRLAAELGA